MNAIPGSSRSRFLRRQIIAGLLCSVAICGARHASADAPIPDTPAGHALSAWLDAFNSGDRTRIQTYYEQHLPPALAGSAVEFRAQTGGFELLGIRASEPLTIEFLVKERSSPRTGVGRLELQDANSGKISNFVLRASAPGAAVIGFAIDAQTRARVVEAIVAALNNYYLSPDVAKRMGAEIRTRLKRHSYDGISDGMRFAEVLTQDLQGVSHDRHLRVDFSPSRLPELPTQPAPPSPTQLAARRALLERDNCAFERVERLSGNIGYLKFNAFMDPEVCGATASAALDFLANVDALIIDLRDNGGGDPQMVAFVASYLFDHATHLNDLWQREGNTTTQFWTLAYVPGKRLTTQPVFVLTSARTFSGAEEFTYDLKTQKRATIVGETTGGGAHIVAGHRVDDRFMLAVPFGKAINPITHTDWEGVGVEPDVKVPAAQALETAEKLALQRIEAASSAAISSSAATSSSRASMPRGDSVDRPAAR
jgi:retinol-binding protein 3